MHSSVLIPFIATGLATIAQAFTQPGAQTWGPLLTPDTTHAVTQGKDFTVTWDPEDHPTDGVTVSLVLCHGPGSNCQLSDSAIATGLPASQKSYDWSVPCDLAPGTASTSTGYGMLIIVDGTGEFQYSTQFSVEAGSCSGSGSSSGSSNSTASTTSGGSSIVIGPPAYQTGASSTWSSGGNWTSTATPTGFGFGTTVTSSAATASYTSSGGAFGFPGTSTVVVGSTLATATTGLSPAQTSSAAGATTSPFTGGAAAARLGGSSMAGMVIAGAVAVFAF